jgi:hypothetical protein
MLSKIARCHCSLKNMVKPLNRFPPEELEQEIVRLVDCYNNQIHPE